MIRKMFAVLLLLATGCSKEVPGNLATDGREADKFADGTIKWSCEIRGIVLKGGLALGPDNTVYAGTTEGWVHGVNPVRSDYKKHRAAYQQ